MQTRYVVDARLAGDGGPLPGAVEFDRQFAAFRPGPTTEYIFRYEEQMNEAVSFLRNINLEFQIFFQFHVDAGEIARYPAFYLGLEAVDGALADGFVNVTKTAGLDLFADYGTRTIVSSSRARAVLAEVTEKVDWSAASGTDGTEWNLLREVHALPQPIMILAPVEINPNEWQTGTYSVRSDGRDVITNAAADALQEVGLAVSRHVSVPSTVLPWTPRYLASGRVIDAIQHAGITGLLQPVTPLLRVSHPLAGETLEGGSEFFRETGATERTDQ